MNNNMNFFIKQNSTLPELKYPLTQKIREKYDIYDEMLQNVAITFSMINADTGIYHIANVSATIRYNEDRKIFPDEERFTLIYNFKLKDTKKSGRYVGEFVLDFLGDTGCGKLKLPVNEQLNIIISDSITKTTVI